MQFHCALAGGLTRTYVFTPTGPWLPGLPGRPGSPFCPRAPRAPTGPALPRNPLTPCGPGSPLGPCLPVDPVLPVAPIAPGSPRKPGLPTGPGAPGAPRAPGLPLAASAPAGPGAPAYHTFLSSRVVGLMCSIRHYARVPIAAASQGTRCEHDAPTQQDITNDLADPSGQARHWGLAPLEVPLSLAGLAFRAHQARRSFRSDPE